MSSEENPQQARGSEADVAIIGMALRFPEASSIEQFWQNLCAGVESIRFFSDDELIRSGVDPAVLADPNYVKARGWLKDIALFDAGFFGYSPREAEITDPQQRLFLECAWEALEHAGYTPESYAGRIGVYAGANLSSYLLFNLLPHPGLIEAVGDFQVLTANDKDYLTTHVSYKLNLKGPSVSVQTACSTSLVAVHLACQSLLNGECDMALAGGVSIALPQDQGYLYREGGILSPDGHCRAFDAKAQGTLFGNGVGIVVLKRLEDALAEGDSIMAVIKGSAINNDGALKIGYTAPSIDGQSEVIAEALAVARIAPVTIGYVEAHGTGTPLGDPIEMAALTRVFSASVIAKGSCAIGSVKTNIGHLDTAAGVAGLIKTVLALKHKAIPPTLHFQEPNPEIDFADTPFCVNSMLDEWEASASPRRAGVSSFGIGGTNAHVVLEEAPHPEPSSASRPWHLLLLSAKTGSGLETMTANLARHLKQHPQMDLADVAYTLQRGRKAFSHRRIVLCQESAEAVDALETRDPSHMVTHMREPGERPLVFMFPGQGAQYPNMGLDLYQGEPIFRAQVDRCAEVLIPHLGCDLRSILYPDETDTAAAQLLNETAITQPALFVIEYALAKLWMAWGVRPQAMIGHSLGEFVAACLAEVFSLEDGLAVVAARGRLMQQLPAGAMLAVPLAEVEVRRLIDAPLSIAAINGPSLCVVTGPQEAVEALERELAERGIESRRLDTSRAFHSVMMETLVEPFTELIGRVALRRPSLPFISNLTGTWITAAAATDPSYWGQHLRQPVRFSEGLAELLKEPQSVLLEVGPGRVLGTLTRQAENPSVGRIVLASMRHPRDQQRDVPFLLSTVGKLWLVGVHIDWAAFHVYERRRRVPLPTYPFERQRYWVEPPHRSRRVAEPQGGHEREPASELAAVEAATAASYSLHPRPRLLTSYVAPRNEIERIITTMWQEILGIEPLGVHDNFFELGGHSLMATRLVSRLREAFPVEVPLRTLFEMTTIAELATLMEELLLDKIEDLPDDEAERLLHTIGSVG
jgi:phthiocerol/phenolphthiocerol synthesis type-I polyketide synthase E